MAKKSDPFDKFREATLGGGNSFSGALSAAAHSRASRAEEKPAPAPAPAPVPAQRPTVPLRPAQPAKKFHMIIEAESVAEGLEIAVDELKAIHEENGEEKLHLLQLDPHIPAGAKLY